MINVAKIKDGLKGLVGYSLPLDPSMSTWVDSDNQKSDSGYYVNSNPFCKLENIRATMDFKNSNDADFNLHLAKKLNESCVNVCNSVFDRADYLCRGVLYASAANKVDANTLPSGMFGYRIKTISKENIAFNISRVFLEFANTGTIKLMLFNSSKSTPIKSKVINITSSQHEEKLDWYVDNTEGYYGGEYFLAYISNTLTPFKRNYDNANLQSYINHIEVLPVNFLNHVSETMPNLLNENPISDYIGVNPDITVYRDYTDQVINNKILFANAICIDTQINIIADILAHNRINSIERNADIKIARMMQEIEGQDGEGVVKVQGLKPRLFKELAKIKAEINKLRNSYLGNGLYISSCV